MGITEGLNETLRAEEDGGEWRQEGRAQPRKQYKQKPQNRGAQAVPPGAWQYLQTRRYWKGGKHSDLLKGKRLQSLVF